MAVQFLLNKNQCKERIREAFIKAGCPDPQFLDVKDPREARKDAFEIHHTTLIEAIPSASVKTLIKDLEAISSISDDLNKIGIDEDEIVSEDGKRRTDVRVMRLAIGKPKTR